VPFAYSASPTGNVAALANLDISEHGNAAENKPANKIAATTETKNLKVHLTITTNNKNTQTHNITLTQEQSVLPKEHPIPMEVLPALALSLNFLEAIVSAIKTKQPCQTKEKNSPNKHTKNNTNKTGENITHFSAYI
jgi:hypothetical protein